MAMVRNPRSGIASRVSAPSGPGMAQPFSSRSNTSNTAFAPGRMVNAYQGQGAIKALSRTLPRGGGGRGNRSMRAVKRGFGRRSSR